MNERAFNEVEQSDQAIKSTFIYTFMNWTKVYIEDHTTSMIDFVDCFSLKEGERFIIFIFLAHTECFLYTLCVLCNASS